MPIKRRIYFQNLTQIQRKSLMEEGQLENEDMKKLLNPLTEGLESQLDPDLFQDDNNVQKKRKNNNEI